MEEAHNQPGGYKLVTARMYDPGQPSNSRMRPVWLLAAYLGAVFLGGALLAPWLYRLVIWTAPHSSLAAKPFHRYLDRSLLAIAVVCIWPLLRSLEAVSPRELFRAAIPGRWRRMAGGFGLGLATVAAMAIIVLGARAREFGLDSNIGRLALRLAGAAATAVAVAVLEELLFRGVIFGALRRSFHWWTALLVSSLIYAMVHFLGKSDLNATVTWRSGLDLLPQMFLHLAGAGFLNLILAGIILGLAYQRTGDLYFSMGLHAGWIFWLKSYGILTSQVAGANTWFWGTERLIDGWLALLILALALAVLPRLTPVPVAKPSDDERLKTPERVA